MTDGDDVWFNWRCSGRRWGWRRDRGAHCPGIYGLYNKSSAPVIKVLQMNLQMSGFCWVLFKYSTLLINVSLCSRRLLLQLKSINSSLLPFYVLLLPRTLCTYPGCANAVMYVCYSGSGWDWCWCCCSGLINSNPSMFALSSKDGFCFTFVELSSKRDTHTDSINSSYAYVLFADDVCTKGKGCRKKQSGQVYLLLSLRVPIVCKHLQAPFLFSFPVRHGFLAAV